MIRKLGRGCDRKNNGPWGCLKTEHINHSILVRKIGGWRRNPGQDDTVGEKYLILPIKGSYIKRMQKAAENWKRIGCSLEHPEDTTNLLAPPLCAVCSAALPAPPPCAVDSAVSPESSLCAMYSTADLSHLQPIAANLWHFLIWHPRVTRSLCCTVFATIPKF